MNQPEKLAKLNDLLKLLQNDTITPNELRAFLTLVLDTIKASKEFFDKLSTQNIKTITDSVAFIQENNARWTDVQDRKTREMLGQFDSKIGEVKALIEKIQTIKPINGVDGTNGRDGVDGKDGSPDKPEEVRDKLEILTGENRLDVSAIRGLDKRDATISEDVTARALGIVDQRTSFLINKVSNLKAQVDNLGAGVSYTLPTASGSTLGGVKIGDRLTMTGDTLSADVQTTDISGKADKSGSLTQFVGNTAWRVFYSDASGDVTELALGADGTFLKSNGAALAPTFATPAGSGDVSKVGTPVNNQIGVWTGDGTIEGDAALTFDTTTDTLATGIVTVTDDAYAAGWDGSTAVPTKNAVYDKIESLSSGGITQELAIAFSVAL